MPPGVQHKHICGCPGKTKIQKFMQFSISFRVCKICISAKLGQSSLPFLQRNCILNRAQFMHHIHSRGRWVTCWCCTLNGRLQCTCQVGHWKRVKTYAYFIKCMNRNWFGTFIWKGFFIDGVIYGGLIHDPLVRQLLLSLSLCLYCG